MQIDTIIAVLATNFRLLNRIHSDLLADAPEQEIHAAVRDLGIMADLSHAAVLRRLQRATAACTAALAEARAAKKRARLATSEPPQYADTLLERRVAVLDAILKAIAAAWLTIPLHADATFAKTNLRLGRVVYHVAAALHHGDP